MAILSTPPSFDLPLPCQAEQLQFVINSYIGPVWAHWTHRAYTIARGVSRDISPGVSTSISPHPNSRTDADPWRSVRGGPDISDQRVRRRWALLNHVSFGSIRPPRVGATRGGDAYRGYQFWLRSVCSLMCCQAGAVNLHAKGWDGGDVKRHHAMPSFVLERQKRSNRI